MANYEICRRHLTAFRTRQLQIICYWIQGEPRICGSRSAQTLLSRTFLSSTNKWLVFGEGIQVKATRGMATRQPICWNYHVEQTVKKSNKGLYYLRDCRKQSYLQRSVSQYIVPRYAHFLNNYTSPVWQFAHEVPCRRVAVYTKQVPRYH